MFSTWAAFNWENNPRLAFGELIGSTILISLATVGLIALLHPFKISSSVFLRDSLFLIFSLWLLCIFLIDAKLELWEGLFMSLFYFAYVFLSSLFVVCGETGIFSSDWNPPLHINHNNHNQGLNINGGSFHTPLDTHGGQDDVISVTDLPSAAPSTESLFANLTSEESLDLSYFQPDLHFTHTFNTRETLQRKLSHASWHRRSYYEVQEIVPEPEPNLSDEDCLEFQPVHPLRPIDTLKKELALWSPFLWPARNAWPKLSSLEKLLAFVQSPFIAFIQLTSPIIEDMHVKVEKNEDYLPLPIVAEIEVEEEVDEIPLTRIHYPVSLLATQLFFAPILWIFLVFGESISIIFSYLSTLLSLSRNEQ